MSPAYRIFINNQRVSTAVPLENERILQTYPERQTFECLKDWMWWQLDEKHRKVKEFTMEYPDGVKKQFFPEKYKLFSEGRCVSAGYRTEEMYLQRYPFHSLYPSHLILVQERAPYFGVSTYLEVKVKAPVVIQPVKPTPEEIQERKRSIYLQRLENIEKARMVARNNWIQRKYQAYQRMGAIQQQFFQSPTNQDVQYVIEPYFPQFI